MKIYTKTGDDGNSGLYGGKRLGKEALRFEAIGDLDELNAAIGLCRIYVKHLGEIDEMMYFVQNKLFILGAELADIEGNAKMDVVSEAEILQMEKWIDLMEADLPALNAFILPGGNAGAAYIHMARVICRRTERAIVRLDREETVRKEVKMFMNRLADLLFVCARTVNHQMGGEEVKWRK